MSDQSQIKQSFGTGAVLARSFSQFFANFWLLLAVILVPNLVLFLLNFFLSRVIYGSISTSDFLPVNGSGSIFSVYPLSYWLLLLLSFMTSYVIWAAAILAIHGRLTGTQISLAGCFKKAIQKFPQMFVLNLVVIVLMFAVAVPVSLIFAAMISFALSFLGGILIFLVIVFIFACFIPLTPAILVGDAGWRSLGRAAGLTRGYRWPIVGLLALILILALIAIFVLGLGVSAISLGLLSSASAGTLSAFVWLSAILNGVITVLVTGYSCTLIVVIYLRLTEIKEGHSGQNLEKVFE